VVRQKKTASIAWRSVSGSVFLRAPLDPFRQRQEEAEKVEEAERAVRRIHRLRRACNFTSAYCSRQCRSQASRMFIAFSSVVPRQGRGTSPARTMRFLAALGMTAALRQPPAIAWIGIEPAETPRYVRRGIRETAARAIR
jgi:hypothetical protein